MARLAFVLPDFHGGGAERVALSLIKGSIERGHDVDLVLVRANGELLRLLPPEVSVIDLKADRMRNAIRPLTRYLSGRRPDAVQASMWPMTLVAILARTFAGVTTRLVISEHSNISAQSRRRHWRTWFVGWSMKLLYPIADARICVSKDVARDLARISGIGLDRFAVIYNPIEQMDGDPTPEAEARWTGKDRRILNVGALKWEKGQISLLRAFAILNRKKPANLMILGEGGLRPAMEQEIRTLGLEGSVSLPGFVLDPAPYYASADVFVLASENEGFANVLVEAMSAGLPVISTDCPSGPREVLDDGRYGRLVTVGDAEAMAEAIELSLSDPIDAQALKVRANEFRPEIAVNRYLALLLSDHGEV